jgi:hypothetical protein
MTVPRTALRQLTPLAEGGFGRIYRADGFTLPGDPTPLAYKEFTRQLAAQGRAANASVSFRDGLNGADRAKLDRYTAWPRAIVTDDKGTVCGVLMPLIPEEFFCQLDEAGDGTLVPKPREMGWLIAPAKQRQDAQIDLPDIDYTDRLLLLAQFVYTIGRLHRHGWVFGDLSFKNAVFALDPPRIILLDCDGAAALADAEREQASTPFWDPPECPIGQASGQGYRQDLQDTFTDVYKLGLAILRCLSPGQGAASSRAPQRIENALDAAGVQLVTHALSSDRASRPTAKELHAYFYTIAAARIAPPVITTARLAMPVVQRGQEAWVDWQIEGPGQVTVTVGKDAVARVDARVHTQGCSFRPLAPGPVRVEVTNPYGRAAAHAGYVALFELPDFSIPVIDLPTPSIPAVQAVSLDAFSAAFESGPDVLASVPEIPPVSAPDIAGVLAGLLPGGVPAIQFPALPVLDAAGAFDGLLSGAAPIVPWPDLPGLYGEFIEAASAVSARVLQDALHNVTMGTGNGQ